VEFVIQQGVLWLLQAQLGERMTEAIACPPLSSGLVLPEAVSGPELDIGVASCVASSGKGGEPEEEMERDFSSPVVEERWELEQGSAAPATTSPGQPKDWASFNEIVAGLDAAGSSTMEGDALESPSLHELLDRDSPELEDAGSGEVSTTGEAAAAAADEAMSEVKFHVWPHFGNMAAPCRRPRCPDTSAQQEACGLEVAASLHQAPPAQAPFPGLLPLWQTLLAGGVASAASCVVGAVAGGAGLVGAGATLARAVPTGALCCTCYTNLCRLTPADGDGLDASAPLWRLGCAATAATVANTLTHPLGVPASSRLGTGARSAGLDLAVLASARGHFRRLGPALRAAVPLRTAELCAIDFVRGPFAGDGEAGPGTLLATGALAGALTHGLGRPLVAAADPAAWGSGSSLRTALKVNPVYMRSIPMVAVDSLLRVGLLSHFTGQ